MDNFEKENRKLFEALLNYKAPFLEFLKTIKSFFESISLEDQLKDEYNNEIGSDIFESLNDIVIDLDEKIDEIESNEDIENDYNDEDEE